MMYKKTISLLIIFFLVGVKSLISQTIKDIDGNSYTTITMGTQTWFAENLKSTKYKNGDIIETTIPASADASSRYTPKYQWSYEGKEKNSETYGKLYTWYTVADDRGICPTGWHVSTVDDWSKLISFLGGEQVAYTRLREFENEHWIKYDPSNDEFKFSARPGGYRSISGSFEDIRLAAYWWSSTEGAQDYAWCYVMTYNLFCINKATMLKRNAFSVRCVRNGN